MKIMNICAVIALSGLFSLACFASRIACPIYTGNDPVKIKEANECWDAQAKRDAQFKGKAMVDVAA